jgi:hypothetical protein
VVAPPDISGPRYVVDGDAVGEPGALPTEGFRVLERLGDGGRDLAAPLALS